MDSGASWESLQVVQATWYRTMPSCLSGWCWSVVCNCGEEEAQLGEDERQRWVALCHGVGTWHKTLLGKEVKLRESCPGEVLWTGDYEKRCPVFQDQYADLDRDRAVCDFYIPRGKRVRLPEP
mgnify:CR=1 FL=1